MRETDIDKALKIHTIGRDDYKADEYHHHYEPTPYVVLDRLIESEFISKENIVIDYGCGKGRVDFYLAAKLGCRCIGIEYDERIFEEAGKNLSTFNGKCKPEFICAGAEEYQIEEGDCFYFYYTDSDYVAYLMTKDELNSSAAFAPDISHCISKRAGVA